MSVIYQNGFHISVQRKESDAGTLKVFGDMWSLRQREPLKLGTREIMCEVYSKLKQHGSVTPQILMIIGLYLQKFTLNIIFVP